IFELEATGDTIFPSQIIGLTLLWEEDWILDTLMSIDTLIYPNDSCCTGGIKTNKQGFQMPPIPEFNCDPFTITFFPKLSANEFDVICHDSTYTVAVTLAGGMPPYISLAQGGMMSNNIFTSDSISAELPNFYFEFMDSGNCEATVMGDNCSCLWDNNLATFELIITEDCGMDSLGTLWVNYLVGGFPTFQYSLDSLDWQIEPFFDSLSAGEYTLYVQDSFACTIVIPFTVTPRAMLLAADLDVQLEICGNEEKALIIPLAEFGETYYIVEWESGDTTKNRTINKSGTYYANVTLLPTCSQFTVVYEVEDISVFSKNNIRLPNAFTPDGDRVNDDFHPIVKDEYVVYNFYSLNIYNRWGQPVFQSKNPDEEWRPVRKIASDVYVWFLEMEIETCDGRLIPFRQSGDLTLIR
ncbi:MAG: gliding motility-associated C-terminal domain-containing protein, partial [Bacteroidota bacterium]